MYSYKLTVCIKDSFGSYKTKEVYNYLNSNILSKLNRLGFVVEDDIYTFETTFMALEPFQMGELHRLFSEFLKKA